ncbi:ABC transporter permease subunit [Mesobacillus selenatarsenatis]|uniref:Oligopeptide transport system permease protein OppB n=1 Tax=Mesobacillus selenatarsenatis (strain DSM 18680 / JCM 14380 / FERM P-15431 / SF-1) TaxID=1321606 RepID=A0A0A8X1G2_MESS1|nr:ABC transporter permease subunit [Mesobacillus selenatarsenatis]GAM11951.1 oligopeptide transport system permease protein OppB [Mesobacillus selenatarsenatis SF-1]
MVVKSAIRFITVILQYIAGVLLFILVGSLPVLMRDLNFDSEGYFHTVRELTVKIFTLSNLTYNGEREMLPAVMERFFYSMKTLGIAFLTAMAIAFLLSYLIVLFFEKKKDYILSFIEIIRSVPDVLWMFLLQAIVIWIYKTFGVKFIQTVSLGSENRAFLLPLISLSMPIFLFLTQIMVLKIFEELDKQYITFAKAKGLSYLYMLNIHVIRNIRQDLLGHFKTIIWMMLSTLVMVEYIFNLDGLMLFNIKHISVELFVFSCILFFTPFFIIYRLIDFRRLSI